MIDGTALNSVRMVGLIDNSIYLQTIVCLTAVYHCCSILARNYRYLSAIPKYEFLNNTKCWHSFSNYDKKNSRHPGH